MKDPAAETLSKAKRQQPTQSSWPSSGNWDEDVDETKERKEGKGKGKKGQVESEGKGQDRKKAYVSGTEESRDECRSPKRNFLQNRSG